MSFVEATLLYRRERYCFLLGVLHQTFYVFISDMYIFLLTLKKYYIYISFPRRTWVLLLKKMAYRACHIPDLIIT